MKIFKEIKESEKINDLKAIDLDIFQDHRGEIWTVYSDKEIVPTFVCDKITISGFGVLRGFHGDSKTAKLVTCLSGKMQFAVVDLRKGSSTYGNIETFIVEAAYPKIIFVPAGCINAHLSLSEKCIFYYKWTKHYDGPENQTTVLWNDPKLNINWILKNPILSERDKKAGSCSNIYL